MTISPKIRWIIIISIVIIVAECGYSINQQRKQKTEIFYSENETISESTVALNEFSEDNGENITKKPAVTQLGGEAIVNINIANENELCLLNGIGPALAQRIITYRNNNGPYKVRQDIMKVSGIGTKRYKQLEKNICVD